MDQVKIPSDEALYAEWRKPAPLTDRLRAVATLAAEQAVKEAVQQIDATLQRDAYLDSCVYHGSRAVVRRMFPECFTPTPPKEQQPVTEASPSPDPATVRLDEATVKACIETIEVHRQDRRASSFTSEEAHFDDGMERAIEHLSSLLPKPTPAPQPERYITLDEVARVLSGNAEGPLYAALDGGKIEMYLHRLRPLAAKRGPMLTPEQALETFSKAPFGITTSDLLAALRRAAKQGGGE